MVVWERVKNSCYLRMYLLRAYVVYILYLRRYCIIFSGLFMFFFILKVDGDKKMIIFVNYFCISANGSAIHEGVDR